MTPTTNQATAADFEPYVAEARAEGMSDAEIVERWMRQARPGCPVSGFGDWLEMELDAMTTAMWILNGYTQLHVVEIRIRTIIAELDVRSDATGKTHDSLEPALAWLANQLAERCPVGVMTEEEAFPDGAPSFDPHSTDPMPKRLAEWVARNRIGSPNPKDAARIRRMFGVGEPSEVGT